jgi:hypothetical protein
MVDTIDSFSFTPDAMSVDCDAIKKRHADEHIGNTTKRLKPRRKFHELECECAECIERYGATVVPHKHPLSEMDSDPATDPATDQAFHTTNEPTMPCLCDKCHENLARLYPHNIDNRVNIFLRRSNNYTCTCGVCMSCMPDYMYFKIISEHIDQIYTCPCMFCQNYREYHTHFGWSLS